MFSMIGMIVIIGGLFYLESIIYPPEKFVITPKMAIWTGFILLCGSTLIHGFHPLLLVKSYGK